MAHQLVETFTIADLRMSIFLSYDRFCKLAHPPLKVALGFEAFHDPHLENSLRALATYQGWPVK